MEICFNRHKRDGEIFTTFKRSVSFPFICLISPQPLPNFLLSRGGGFMSRLRNTVEEIWSLSSSLLNREYILSLHYLNVIRFTGA